MNAFDSLLRTVAKLRAPDGCPWDRAQDHKSLRKHLLEETYEVLELLDRADADDKTWSASLKEELGDLLLQILLHSRMAEEKNLFAMEDVIHELNEKLIRRHPHVFGGEKAENAAEALKNWEAEKAKDQKNRKTLDGIPEGLPALQRAQKVIEKVSKVGFQWENLGGPWEKLGEEIRELKAEIEKVGPVEKLTRKGLENAPNKEKIENELGDLLFSIANISHFLHVNSEDALRSMLERFTKRFQHVESSVKASGKNWKEFSLEELDRFWDEAKKKN